MSLLAILLVFVCQPLLAEIRIPFEGYVTSRDSRRGELVVDANGGTARLEFPKIMGKRQKPIVIEEPLLGRVLNFTRAITSPGVYYTHAPRSAGPPSVAGLSPNVKRLKLAFGETPEGLELRRFHVPTMITSDKYDDREIDVGVERPVDLLKHELPIFRGLPEPNTLSQKYGLMIHDRKSLHPRIVQVKAYPGPDGLAYVIPTDTFERGLMMPMAHEGRAGLHGQELDMHAVPISLLRVAPDESEYLSWDKKYPVADPFKGKAFNVLSGLPQDVEKIRVRFNPDPHDGIVDPDASTVKSAGLPLTVDEMVGKNISASLRQGDVERIERLKKVIPENRPPYGSKPQAAAKPPSRGVVMSALQLCGRALGLISQ